MKLYKFNRVNGKKDLCVYDNLIFSSKETCCKYIQYFNDIECDETEHCKFIDNKLIFIIDEGNKCEYKIEEINIENKETNYVVFEKEEYDNACAIGYATSLDKAISMAEKELLLDDASLSELNIKADTLYFNTNNALDKAVIIKPFVFDEIESYVLYPKTIKDKVAYYNMDFSRV